VSGTSVDIVCERSGKLSNISGNFAEAAPKVLVGANVSSEKPIVSAPLGGGPFGNAEGPEICIDPVAIISQEFNCRSMSVAKFE